MYFAKFNIAMVNSLKAKNTLEETPEISALDHTQFFAIVYPLGMLWEWNAEYFGLGMRKETNLCLVRLLGR